MREQSQGLTVVIPAYNEGEAIRTVVEEAHRALKALGIEYEILVVDDGSADETAAEAERGGARVLVHPANAGYGKAILTGAEHARFDLIGIMDGDATYPPEEFAKLLPHADRFDMVVGARMGQAYEGGFVKQRGRWAFNGLAKFVTGERVPDVNSGMRIFKRHVLDQAQHVVCRGFSFSTTLTLSALGAGFFVKHVPIRYRPRVGRSRVRYLRDTLRAGQVLVETAIYFNPLKAAFCLALVPLVAAAGFVIWAAAARSVGLLAVGVGCALSALGIFALGLLMDLVRMRR